jgi:hypothetical protein
MNYWKIPLAMLAALSASLALADDFKTIDGKEYKNVTVSRVEPDGIALKSKSGISKVYFTELPKEVQERFHYDAQQAAQYAAQTIEKNNLSRQQEAEETQKRAEQAAAQLAMRRQLRSSDNNSRMLRRSDDSGRLNSSHKRRLRLNRARIPDLRRGCRSIHTNFYRITQFDLEV